MIQLLSLPIALILSILAGVSAAQQEEISIPSSLLISASSGDAESQFLLGQSLDQGQLFGAEIREAFSWYKRAADQGFALGEVAVGKIYVEGRGVPQNFTAGEDYLFRAAIKGLSSAQLALGQIKLESEEFTQAYLLFSLAVTLAEDEATYKEAMAGRSEVEKSLQEVEIMPLQSRATTCIESDFEQCDFGPLSLEDLSFLIEVEPESEITEPQALETPAKTEQITQVIESSQNRNEGSEQAALAADYIEFTPASFGKQKNVFIERLSQLSLPVGSIPEGAVVTARCLANIKTARGQIVRPFEAICTSVIGENIQQNILDQIANFVQETVINLYGVTPASVKGKKIQVMMPFSVLYRNSGDRLAVRVVQNHLYMATELGMDYSAAQSTVIKAPHCGRKTIGVVSLHVNANGTVDSVEQLSDTLSEDCLQSLLKKYNSQGNFGPRAFIPAMHNGRPIESRSIQVVRWLRY